MIKIFHNFTLVEIIKLIKRIMGKQNNTKKKKPIAKIIYAITIMGVLIALILNTTQLADRFSRDVETQKKVDTLIISLDTNEAPIIKSQENKKEDVKEGLDKRIEQIIEEARRVKSKSPSNSRTKYLEANELLSESQKNRQFINSINNSTSSIDFGTQINLLDSFFISLNLVHDKNINS